MVEPGHQVSQTLLREFSEEALGELDKTEEERMELQAKVKELLKHGTEVSTPLSVDHWRMFSSNRF